MTNEDVTLIEKFIKIRNKGLYANGVELTDVYNRVLEKNLPPTNCSSCIRSRISELERALNQFKKQMELSGMTSTEQLVNEIKAVEEEINTDKPKRGRPKKKEG